MKKTIIALLWVVIAFSSCSKMREDFDFDFGDYY